jgi:two-component system phosphate regulon sensor histidine kinase PhoR
MLIAVSRRWRASIVSGLVIAVVIALAVYLINRAIADRFTTGFEDAARGQAAVVLQDPRWTAARDPEQRQALLEAWQTALGARILWLGADGAVIAASDPALGQAAAFFPLPWAGDVSLRRIDPATGQDTLYIVEPFSPDGAAAGGLLLAFPTAPLDGRIAELQRFVRTVGLLATLVIFALVVVQRERAMRTVRQLTHVADRITAGELEARILALNTGEVGQLTRSFNRMAGELESEIQKHERERDRLFTVMHVMADGVLILTRKGKVRMINPTAANLLSTNESTAEGRSFIQVVRDHRIAEVWQRCQASGEQQVSALDLGPNRFLRVIVTPFLRGADRGYVVILQDLTRLRQLQTVRQDFVSNVSHELRTPLASLRALVDTLRDGALDDPPAAIRFLDRMEVEVDSLTQLVEELLELSRIESGKVPLQFRRASVHEVIGAGAERLRPQAERNEVLLSVEIDEETPDILVDPDRVQQVITNLVHNAIKFTPVNGQVEVTVRRHTDDFVVVSVADTGVGIPPDELPWIFERFYKTDRARSTGGTGLGLAIAKHIVQSHGGVIWAESTPEYGSTFYLTLPTAPSMVMEKATLADSIAP